MSQRVSKQTGLSLCPSFSLPCGGYGSFPPMTDSQPATPRSCFPLHSWLFVRWRILIDIIPVVIHVASMIYPRAQSPRQRRKVLNSVPLIFLHHSCIPPSLPSSLAQSDQRSPRANPGVSSSPHSDDPHVPASSSRIPNTPYSQTGTLSIKTPTFPHKPPACVAHSETSVPRHPPRFAR